MFQAQKHIREKDEVILVEGYFDVLALHAMGFRNVVASCGTALSADHLSLFKRFTNRITILFDGDRAGLVATEKAMELGLAHGMVLTGAVIPNEQDPDQVLFDTETGVPVPGGKERMEEILKGAKPLIDTRLEDAIRMAEGGPEARTQALKRIGGWLAKFNDPVGKEVRIQFVQDRLGVPRQLLLQAMGGEKSGKGGGGYSPASPPRNQASPILMVPLPPQSGPQGFFPGPEVPYEAPGAYVPRNPGPFVRRPPFQAVRGSSKALDPRQLNRMEKALLGGIARGGKYAQLLMAAAGKMPPDLTIADLFDYLPAREFVLKLMTFGEDFARFGKNPSAYLDDSLDSQVRQILTEALVAGDEDLTEESFSGALDRSIARCWARFSQRIRAALSDAEAKKDAGLQSKLMKEYLDVQRKMKEFISFYDEA
jgi:DNA primase